MNTIIFGLIRHALTMLSGVLVANNYTDPTSAESIAGGISALVAVIWSIVEKRRAQ